MDATSSAARPLDGLENLRQRNIPLKTESSDKAKEVVEELNSRETPGDEKGQAPKTYGRTPSGVVFVVPQTHDMVSQLLFPNQPKNLGDLFVVFIISMHLVLLAVLPNHIAVPTLAAIFLFWRGAYNAGVGYLLHIQSNDRRLITWARKSGIFEKPESGKNPHPALYRFIKRELESKIPENYSFDDAPIEYNTWLVFRRVIDLILMCDFTSYCCFAAACGGGPPDESFSMTAFRWIAGWGLIFFNLWVKLDAHRVVKDFAWYWGDFFYLIDQRLTFDGVFELAPHPMYSVGYVGYYGISLMAASYRVLFISIVAHLAQFAFLIWVENPHIEKIYNPPAPRKQSVSQPSRPPLSPVTSERDISPPGSPPTPTASNTAGTYAASKKLPTVHKLLGLRNMDFFRVTDTSVMLLQLYLLALVIFTPKTQFFQYLFLTNAAAWRLWHTVGLGYLLNRQSNDKLWTRHFVKWGETSEEAWKQWKGLYHLSLSMTHGSYIAATWKFYSIPTDWNDDMAMLRHTLGAALACLHLWTSVSIYDSLGEFGWFYGDFFFFDSSTKLTYSGIYRFLNNPERVIGLAGLWSAVLVTQSRDMFFLALASHVLSLCFIQFVERPHMERRYGHTALRGDSGVVKNIKRSLPPAVVRQWEGKVDRFIGGTAEAVEDLLSMAKPRLASGIGTIVKDSSALLEQPSRMTIVSLDPEMAGFDPEDYSIEILNESLSKGPDGKPDRGSLAFAYGTPIKLRWTAPLNHSAKDWIGLYRASDNPSREVTRVRSFGRWVATNADAYSESLSAGRGCLAADVREPAARRRDGSPHDFLSGRMEFAGDKLWWLTGVYEFRYHHNGRHNVTAISQPFELRVDRFDDNGLAVSGTDSSALPSLRDLIATSVSFEAPDDPARLAVERVLLPLVRDCFDRDPDTAPETAEETYGALVERDGKYSKRVVYAVTRMFGIEFAPEVVQADGCVRNLAWRICNAKQVLAPYSMSGSNGRNTPVSST